MNLGCMKLVAALPVLEVPGVCAHWLKRLQLAYRASQGESHPTNTVLSARQRSSVLWELHEQAPCR